MATAPKTRTHRAKTLADGKVVKVKVDNSPAAKAARKKARMDYKKDKGKINAKARRERATMQPKERMELGAKRAALRAAKQGLDPKKAARE